MIGFSQDFQLYRNLDDEGDDTKNLDKHELYEIIAKEYMIPPVNTKGVTREYLLQVKDGQVFRVTHRDHKNFEFTLDKDQKKKVGVVNNALLVRKLNLLLTGLGQRPLGFTEYNLPDQNWLYQVARYIDRTNVLEFFEKAAVPEPPLSDSSSIISQIYHGRSYAFQWLFRVEKARKNKKFWDSLSALSEKHRNLWSAKVNADVLEYELREIRDKIAKQDVELHDMIGKISFTYTSLENPSITPELVIGGGDALTESMRNDLNTNQRL